MGKTSIEWTDRSINPFRARDITTGAVGHYCEKISPGCLHCYSSNFQPRFHMPTFGGKSKFAPLPSADGIMVNEKIEVFFDDSRLREVLRRKTPTKWFWCDMTDMFGSWVPFDWIDKCFAVMALTPHHTHPILTKRPERMAEYLNDPSLPNRIYRVVMRWLDDGEDGFLGKKWNAAEYCASTDTEGEPQYDKVKWKLPLPNVWFGTSVENQKCADDRIPWLLKCPAAVRFLSCEPLLGPLDLTPWLKWRDCKCDGEYSPCACCDAQGPREDIGWVIVGGESGHGARACQVEWIHNIIEQCKDAGVPCFVKQLGAKPTENIDGGCDDDGNDFMCEPTPMPLKLKSPKGGDIAEWPDGLRVREFPKVGGVA